MRRIVLAYPHQHVHGQEALGCAFLTVIDPDGPNGWPDCTAGPNPLRVREAADHLVSISCPGDLLLPMGEEAVLPCALAAERSDAEGPSLPVARRCVDRREQRLALESTGLNPRWAVDDSPRASGPFVVKAAASTLSSGVILADSDDLEVAIRRMGELDLHQVDALTEACGAPDYTAVVEEYVDGEQWEVDGVVGADPRRPLILFNPLRQRWDRPAGRILAYERVDDEELAWELEDAALAAVRAIGIRWSGFSVELRGDPIRVVEIHHRLGEGGGEYARLLSPDCDPAVMMCRMIAREWC